MGICLTLSIPAGFDSYSSWLAAYFTDRIVIVFPSESSAPASYSLSFDLSSVLEKVGQTVVLSPSNPDEEAPLGNPIDPLPGVR